MYIEKEKKSLLFKLKPLVERLPAVKRPEGHVHFKTKLLWTILILIFYFILTNVMLYGLESGPTLDMFAGFRAIMAGESGSILHLGIGPIVTASIILQLFVGAKIIRLDLTKSEDKAIYQGTQKFLVLVMIFVEAIPQVFGYLTPSSYLIARAGLWGARWIIISQLFVGSYLVFLMDEVVSKWGIGSGISLFIAAGVSQAIFTGTFNWALGNPNLPASIERGAMNLPVGTIPKTIYIAQNMNAQQLASEGYETIMLGQPNPMIALVGTVLIFFIVAYVESTRIELPLAHGRVRGARGRYPIRLIYASNIPVILMSALLANVQMFSLLLWQHPTLSKIPLIGGQYWVGAYGPQSTEPIGGAAFYLTRVRGLYDWLLPLIDYQRWSYAVYGKSQLQIVAHVAIYLGVMIIGSILFAKFWIETTNMGSAAVAEQITESGLQIPGFRRDPRIIKLVLDRYIPAVTVISGAFVGALAAGADMIGTVGNTSGTGVLLCVGIIIQFYELIGREQMMEMHPVLRGFFGEE
ncbi:MAG: preprotein translocase subunit SecY [Candidatus Thermoplasmatota archaeon]|nr:preprotein translocase subunit SecY [Candidatus Thermoplasmatota archaeon]